MIFKKKENYYELAREDARACDFSFRPGDVESDHKLRGSGVRIVVHEFGDYQPFILTNNSKEWIQRAYKLTEVQACNIYSLLIARAKREIRRIEAEQSRYNQFRHGNSSADRLKEQFFSDI